ncbi:MAG TPA: hypothetical protein PLQ57_12145 [Saprospiraceae bacterium]|nr:hypothetical protein [Saprospiraceae bacterium]HRG21780.1 hypothetical protein [Saprospiraceae bacterium]HRG64646.1 hypothetical protein [Saprospiraceae bacterium]
MKSLLYQLLVEKNVRSKVDMIRQKNLLGEIIEKDSLQADYNPKTARHRSLKNINAKLIQF